MAFPPYVSLLQLISMFRSAFFQYKDSYCMHDVLKYKLKHTIGLSLERVEKSV